jgi:hypothetical protein
MNIGFDLDNVFINTPPFVPHAVIERLYRKKANGILLYRIPSRKEQIIRMLSHYHPFRPVIKDNMQVLQNLPKSDHKLYLISSRFGFLRTITNQLVKKHKLDTIFDELHFNFDNRQPHIFKSDIINTLKLDKFVDDDLYLLKYIASKNNKIKLYWLNKKVQKKLSANITAITRLSDMFAD